MSLAYRISNLRTEDVINVVAVLLVVIGIICLAQQDTATSKKGGTRIFGGICLGIVGIILAYKVYKLSQEIVSDERNIYNIENTPVYERSPIDEFSEAARALKRRAIRTRADSPGVAAMREKYKDYYKDQ